MLAAQVSNRETFQYQKRRSEENRRKILEVLGKHGEMGFTQLLRLTFLSRRTLNNHLRSLREEGILDHAPSGKHYLKTREQMALSTFGDMYLAEELASPYFVDDPRHCFDEYGLVPFVAKVEKQKAKELASKLVDVFLFIIMKMASHLKEGDVQGEWMWVRECLEKISEHTQRAIERYVDGHVDFYIRNGENWEGLLVPLTPNRLGLQIRVSTRVVMVEEERRRKARAKYLMKAIEQMIGLENMREFENLLESLERIDEHFKETRVHIKKELLEKKHALEVSARALAGKAHTPTIPLEDTLKESKKKATIMNSKHFDALRKRGF